MKDMAEGADLPSGSVETLSDPNAAASLEQKQAGNKELADMPKTTPMMVEERARTLRDANEDLQRKPLQEKDRFLLHLNIALSVENAAVERLHARIQQCQLPRARERLAHHLEETREQKNRLVSLIQKLGGQATGERAQLPEWSPPKALANALEASITQEEQELKSMEIDALIEHAEAIGYNILIQMAAKMNIGEAMPALRQSLKEEEDMVAWARANLPSNFAQLWSEIEWKRSMRQALA